MKRGDSRGKLIVSVWRDWTGWARRLGESSSGWNWFQNFPRYYHGIEVGVRNLNSGRRYYINTQEGEAKAELPPGNYRVTVLAGPRPRKNVTVFENRKNYVSFTIASEHIDKRSGSARRVRCISRNPRTKKEVLR